MSKNKEPQFKARGKCVVSDLPKLKDGNIVIRGTSGNMTVERVVVDTKNRKRKVKQPWPGDLVLVVRGPLADSIIEYFNKNYTPDPVGTVEEPARSRAAFDGAAPS